MSPNKSEVENMPDKINRLTLEQFTTFEKAEFEFSSNINIRVKIFKQKPN